MSAVFGITGVLSTGVGASWVKQSSSPATSLQRAQALGATGNEVANSLYDSTIAVTETWIAKDSVALGVPDIGAVVDTYVITDITVGTSNTGFATLSITAHKHTDGTPAMTAATGFGALVTAAFGALNLSGATGSSGVLNSSSIQATCQHGEAKGADGNNIAGENYNCMLTCTQTYIDGGVMDTTWGVTSTSTAETNTGYQVRTIVGTKTLALA
jgi:hypothetical protein